MSATSELGSRPKIVMRKVPPQMWRDTISRRPQQIPDFGRPGRVCAWAFFAYPARVSTERKRT